MDDYQKQPINVFGVNCILIDIAMDTFEFEVYPSKTTIFSIFPNLLKS